MLNTRVRLLACRGEKEQRRGAARTHQHCRPIIVPARNNTAPKKTFPIENRGWFTFTLKVLRDIKTEIFIVRAIKEGEQGQLFL